MNTDAGFAGYDFVKKTVTERFGERLDVLLRDESIIRFLRTLYAQINVAEHDSGKDGAEAISNRYAFMTAVSRADNKAVLFMESLLYGQSPVDPVMKLLQQGFERQVGKMMTDTGFLKSVSSAFTEVVAKYGSSGEVNIDALKEMGQQKIGSFLKSIIEQRNGPSDAEAIDRMIAECLERFGALANEYLYGGGPE